MSATYLNELSKLQLVISRATKSRRDRISSLDDIFEPDGSEPAIVRFTPLSVELADITHCT